MVSIRSPAVAGTFYPANPEILRKALAKKKSRQIKTIDLRNSGDTAGDKQQVVGYGAYVIN